MLEAALERTPIAWLERRLCAGRDGRRDVYRHIASVYARPLAAYYRESPWRWVADVRSVLFGFFARRVFRKAFLERWAGRDVPLRRWLVKAFAYYLAERAREGGGGGSPMARKLALQPGNPERAYHRALAESLVGVALAEAREDCERRGMSCDWKLFFQYACEGRPSAELLARRGVDPVSAASAIHRAIERFRSALRELFERDGLPEGGINREIRFLLAARKPAAADGVARAGLEPGSGHLRIATETRERAVDRLLALGLAGLRRPVDGLIARLREGDGQEQLASLLEAGPARRFGSIEGTLLRGGVSLAVLFEIKEESKRLYRASVQDPEARLSGIATYFLALASALANRAARISGTAEDEVRTAWLDLACVAPPPWAELFARAALGLTGGRLSSLPPPPPGGR